MFSYHRPVSTEEALSILNREPCVPLAGGTDFYPERVGKPIQENVMDLTGIRSLRGIEERAEGIWMGALTTWTDVMHADLPKAFQGLQQASRTIGGVQTQNAGTLCGNLCNASPAADSVPNLMALEAQVELESVRGSRRLDLQEFILGNRKTAKADDELVTGLLIPKPSANAFGAFEKLGARKYLVISIVMTGVVAEWNEDQRIGKIRIAVGSCSEKSIRREKLEKECEGKRMDQIRIRTEHLENLSPIDDIRAKADFRLEVVSELILRAVRQTS